MEKIKVKGKLYDIRSIQTIEQVLESCSYA